MTLNAHAKGATYERRIAALLTEWWGGSFRRSPLSGGWDKQRAPGDLVTPGDFPWVVECKNRQGWTFRDLVEGRRHTCRRPTPRNSLPIVWWEQVSLDAADSGTGRLPMLVMTRRQWPDYVVLGADSRARLLDVATMPRALAVFSHLCQPLYLLRIDQLTALDPESLRVRS